jgi:ubiquinone/menaquinone biosynthesis C-methylase UbiE
VWKHYQSIARHFDELFADPEALMASEAQMLDRVLAQFDVKTVLDCACGTGIQSVGLARLGYSVTAADLSARMLAVAKAKVQREGLPMRFIESDFQQLQQKVSGEFDAVICCGNSLPHLREEAEFREAVRNMSEVLKEGGITIVEVRNYDKLVRQRDPIELRRAETSRQDLLLVFDVRDFHDDWVRVINVFLQRRRGRWRLRTYEVDYTCIGTWTLLQYIRDSGLAIHACLDGLTGEPYSADESDWLVVVGKKDVAEPLGLREAR